MKYCYAWFLACEGSLDIFLELFKRQCNDGAFCRDKILYKNKTFYIGRRISRLSGIVRGDVCEEARHRGYQPQPKLATAQVGYCPLKPQSISAAGQVGYCANQLQRPRYSHYSHR
jgi:hypothetical protein